MFGWFKKKAAGEDPEARFNEVAAYYEGDVDPVDYWDPENPEDYNGGHIIPDGFGKLTFSVNGEIRETYEGQLTHGAYDGEGKLWRNGKTFEGYFEGGKYVGKSEEE